MEEELEAAALVEAQAAIGAALTELESATETVWATYYRAFVDGCRGLMAANGAGLLAVVTLSNGTFPRRGLALAGDDFLTGLTIATLTWSLALFTTALLIEFESLPRKARIAALLNRARRGDDAQRKQASRIAKLMKAPGLSKAVLWIAVLLLASAGWEFISGARELVHDVGSPGAATGQRLHLPDATRP